MPLRGKVSGFRIQASGFGKFRRRFISFISSTQMVYSVCSVYSVYPL